MHNTGNRSNRQKTGNANTDISANMNGIGSQGINMNSINMNSLPINSAMALRNSSNSNGMMANSGGAQAANSGGSRLSLNGGNGSSTVVGSRGSINGGAGIPPSVATSHQIGQNQQLQLLQQQQQQQQQNQQNQQRQQNQQQQSQQHNQNQSHQQMMNNQMPMIPQPALMALNSMLTLGPYKHRRDLTRESVLSAYQIIGYIAAGTYGKVYKAKLKKNQSSKDHKDDKGGESAVSKALGSYSAGIVQVMDGATTASPSVNASSSAESAEQLSIKKAANENNVQLYAIKKFKSDNHLSTKTHHNHDIHGNEVIHYTGISQSAIREMSLCRELNNKNITKLIDIILENKSIYMVFEFCEHDLLQIIHYHLHPEIKPIPQVTIKSLIWQILNGVSFLHQSWIFHRDLKPANIMVSSQGVVKIGDLGLARKFNNPLQSLYTGDKVVVTIWYRAPELLLGARHYNTAIDLWAVGCILAELLSLRPIFKGEEAKIDINNKKSVPFQKNQFQKIVEILGAPNLTVWPSLNKYPEFVAFQQQITGNFPPNLINWFKLIGGTNRLCLSLLTGLLEYDPSVRLTADAALVHPYFLELPKVQDNAFEGVSFKYPKRRIYSDDNDIISNHTVQNNYKRHHGVYDDTNNNTSNNNTGGAIGDGRKRQK